MVSTQAVSQNPWWLKASFIDEDPHLCAVQGKPYYLTRPLLKEMQLQAGDIHVLRGARQVGKTTLIKEMIAGLLQQQPGRHQKIFYLSCEGIEDFKDLHNTIFEWLGGHKDDKSYVFLDEISFIKEWQRAILGLAKSGHLRNVSVLITGSNARDLKESSERFPGRRGQGKDWSLHPLSWHDYSKLTCFSGKSARDLLQIYFSVGGFPHAIRDYAELGLVTDTTYETYRNWIIGDATRYSLSEEFLKHILYRIGTTLATRITWQSLIENTPVKSHETALAYLEHLQDAFLCHTIHCYDPDMDGPAIHKSRKVYFTDPLLIYLALGWKSGLSNMHHMATGLLQERDFLGKVLENMVVSDVGRFVSPIYFWYSTKQKKEVDLVLSRHGKVQLFEVKLGEQSSFQALNQAVTIITPETLTAEEWWQ